MNFKIGDKVKILSYPEEDIQGLPGYVGFVTWVENHKDDDNYYLVLVDNIYRVFPHEIELVKEGSMNFKIGDKVRIIKFPNLDYIGEIREITGTEELDSTEYFTLDHSTLALPEEIELVEKENKEMFYAINNDSIVVYIEGQPKSVTKDHINYNKIRQALVDKEFDSIEEMIDIKTSVVNRSGGRVSFDGEDIYYDGEVVTGPIADKILQLFSEGFDIEPWLLFMENLMENPSFNSRRSLFTFLEHWNAPITEDGHFIAWKYVNEDFLDAYSRTFDNSPGKVVEMDRQLVDDNINNTCSHGLHVCASSYLPGYARGYRVVMVKVNPRDVVAVPTDYNGAKMRTCRYEVLREVDKEYIEEHESRSMITLKDWEYYV